MLVKVVSTQRPYAIGGRLHLIGSPDGRGVIVRNREILCRSSCGRKLRRPLTSRYTLLTMPKSESRLGFGRRGP